MRKPTLHIWLWSLMVVKELMQKLGRREILEFATGTVFVSGDNGYTWTPARANWTTAKLYCKQIGLSLLRIDDMTTFSEALVQAKHLQRLEDSGAVWLGAYYSTLDNQYRWDDNKELIGEELLNDDILKEMDKSHGIVFNGSLQTEAADVSENHAVMCMGRETFWFGTNNKYRCNCRRGPCNPEGVCLEADGRCAPGWFGENCQFRDVLRDDGSALTDFDDKTCENTTETPRTFRMDRKLHVTWIRVVWSTGKMENLRLEVLGPRGRFIDKVFNLVIINENTADLQTSVETADMLAFRLKWDDSSSLCSVHIFGGRNVALKQNASLSSLTVNSSAQLAVDGARGIFSQSAMGPEGERFQRWTLELADGNSVAFEVVIYLQTCQSNKMRDARLTLQFVYVTDDDNDPDDIQQVNFTPERISVSLIPDHRKVIARLYISLEQRAGEEKRLELSEVEVYGDCAPRFYGEDCHMRCPDNCLEQLCHFNGQCYSQANLVTGDRISTSKTPMSRSVVPVSTSQLSVSRSQFPVSRSQLPVSISKYQVSTSETLVSTTSHTTRVMSSTKASETMLLPSTVTGPAPEAEGPPEALTSELSVSRSQFPVSRSQLPVSTTKYQVSTSETSMSTTSHTTRVMSSPEASETMSLPSTVTGPAPESEGPPEEISCEIGTAWKQCALLCHCQNKMCDTYGNCLEGSLCEEGWFALFCQYRDLATESVMKYDLLKDNDDSTCFSPKQNQVTADFQRVYILTWVRLVFVFEAQVRNLTLMYFDVVTGRSKLCEPSRVKSELLNTYDLFCGEVVRTNRIVVTWAGMGSLCTLNINGGRNVAPLHHFVDNKTENYVIFPTPEWGTSLVDPLTDGDQEFIICHELSPDNSSISFHFQRELFIQEITLFTRNSDENFTIEGHFGDPNAHFKYTSAAVGEHVIFFADTLFTVTSSVTLLVVEGLMELCEVEIYGDCAPPNYYLDCSSQCHSTCLYSKCNYDGFCYECPGQNFGKFCSDAYTATSNYSKVENQDVTGHSSTAHENEGGLRFYHLLIPWIIAMGVVSYLMSIKGKKKNDSSESYTQSQAGDYEGNQYGTTFHEFTEVPELRSLGSIFFDRPSPLLEDTAVDPGDPLRSQSVKSESQVSGKNSTENLDPESVSSDVPSNLYFS